jgi:hypothetical protein
MTRRGGSAAAGGAGGQLTKRLGYRLGSRTRRSAQNFSCADFCNKICHHRKSVDFSITSSVHSSLPKHLGSISKRERIAAASPVHQFLMQDVLDRATRQQAAGVRLLQAGFHNRSLCLYTELGFRTREPVSILQGKSLGQHFPGYEVRPATAADVAACNRICHQIHGFDRGGELQDAISQKAAFVVERLGRITGYTTEIAFFAHSVAETNQDLLALIGAAPELGGPGFLLPTRNHHVFKWCLEAGLKLVSQMTLMTIGLYNEPTGPYMPSVLY